MYRGTTMRSHNYHSRMFRLLGKLEIAVVYRSRLVLERMKGASPRKTITKQAGKGGKEICSAEKRKHTV